MGMQPKADHSLHNASGHAATRLRQQPAPPCAAPLLFVAAVFVATLIVMTAMTGMIIVSKGQAQ